jgi:hypothetical protein
MTRPIGSSTSSSTAPLGTNGNDVPLRDGDVVTFHDDTFVRPSRADLRAGRTASPHAPVDDFGSHGPNARQGIRHRRPVSVSSGGMTAATAAAKERSRAVAPVLSQVRAIPLPPDPFARLGPRPESTQRVIERQRAAALDDGAHLVAGAVLGLAGEKAGEWIGKQRGGSEGERLGGEIGGQIGNALLEVHSIGSAIWEGRTADAVEGLATAAVTHGISTFDYFGRSALGSLGGALVSGGVATIRAAAHNIVDGRERRAAAQAESEWNRGHQAATEATRNGRLNAEADLRLIRQGADPAQQVDMNAVRTNRAYAQTIREGLERMSAGR